MFPRKYTTKQMQYWNICGFVSYSINSSIQISEFTPNLNIIFAYLGCSNIRIEELPTNNPRPSLHGFFVRAFSLHEKQPVRFTMTRNVSSSPFVYLHPFLVLILLFFEKGYLARYGPHSFDEAVDFRLSDSCPTFFTPVAF